tara:strand:- start:33 stop:611 length:579 start_codon:yes stop_codon:yes gene_type:complete
LTDENEYLPKVLDEYRISFDNELRVFDFVNIEDFYKISIAQLKPKNRFINNPEVNPIDYIVQDGLMDSYEKYKEVIYIIAFDEKIVKIGKTKVGMKGRHQSYNCGTRKARKKGTCSVTNYNVTETQYTAIRDGVSIDWYAYDVPQVIIPIEIFGEKHDVIAETNDKYESVLINQYIDATGHKPLLSVNIGAS